MVDIENLEHTYFYFDKPVPYQVQNNKTIYINPIKVVDSEYFISSIDLLTIDKNSWPSAEIIKMSYLEFLVRMLLMNGGNEVNKSNVRKYTNICKLCLDLNNPLPLVDDDNKMYLYDKEKDIVITSKQFDDIKRIILYQNISHYDDEYINPEVKQMMAEMDELKNKGIEMPSLERKIAIISAHCGISKREQLEMTYRSHTLLFNEVCGEVDYTVKMPIALYSGQGDKVGHWIFKKEKGKFDDYFVSRDSFSKSMGDEGAIKQTFNNEGKAFEKQFNSF